MWRSLHDTWWRLATTPPRSAVDVLLIGLLNLLAGCYGWLAGLRNAAYDRGWLRQAHLACPVVSVGNLTVGGTGKTACVEYLAAAMREAGRCVCILSRGYGGRRRPYWLLQKGGVVVVNGQADGLEGVADEPRLLAEHLPEVPVVVGARRDQTGQQAIEQFQAEALLLDDGFQHRRLRRDCEIVLVSAAMPLAGWPLLPRGPMREPLESLRRADVVILTKADQSLSSLGAWQERIAALNPKATVLTALHEPLELWDPLARVSLPLARVSGASVALVSSIGDPEGFEETMRRLSALVRCHLVYPDHHEFQPADWQAVTEAAKSSGACAVVTTEKDFMRLRKFLESSESSRLSVPDDAGQAGLPVWLMRIRMRILSGASSLHDRLTGLWSG